MLTVPQNRTYRLLFTAQVIALIGTGLMTVALGLLAYDLAGADAGAVLGTALAIKMIAYVGIAPIAQAFADRVPRRAMLVALDLLRALIALTLPFVSEIWQIYLIIFVLQAASAAFTPTFQATIPDILPDEREYTKALSLSRLAYDLESLASPMIAAAMLTIMSYHDLFVGTWIGFIVSTAIVFNTRISSPLPSSRRGIWDRTTRGLRIYLATPRLRGLLAICLAVSSAGAMVIVNTVVIVQSRMGLAEPQVALALGAFGGGSMLAALVLPRVLDRFSDRSAMIGGALLLVVGTGLGALISSFSALVALWFVLGIGYSTAQTPAGRLLRRSAHAEDRPALFAAQFALSHACWLLCYPLAGRFGAGFGLEGTFLVMSALGFAGVILALRLWPTGDPAEIAHVHPELPLGHPHLLAHGQDHRHALIIDDLHESWPRQA